MEQSAKTPTGPDKHGKQPGGDDNGVGKLIWVAAGGLIAAFVLAQTFKPKANDENSSGNGSVNPSVVGQAEQPYVEQGDGTTISDMRAGFQHPRAKVLNDQGEVVPANPAIARQMEEQERELARRKEQLRLNRDRFRAPPPPGLEDKVAAPPGGWTKQKRGGLDPNTSPAETGQPDYVVAAFQEMRANGELDSLVDAQYKMMIKDLEAGYDEAGGPSRQEIEEMREEKRVIFQ